MSGISISNIIFSNIRANIIPKFQRIFEWAKVEYNKNVIVDSINVLFNSFAKNDYQSTGNNHHFKEIEVFELHKEDEDYDESITQTNQFLIIDGQQRLTMLFLLNIVLSKILRCSGDEDFKNYDYNIRSRIRNNVFTYNIIIQNEKANGIFKDTITEFVSMDDTEEAIENYFSDIKKVINNKSNLYKMGLYYIYEFIEQKFENDTEKISNFVDYIYNCTINESVSRTFEEAIDRFVTCNDIHKTLSNNDIGKSLLIKLIDVENDRENYTKFNILWDNINEKINELKLFPRKRNSRFETLHTAFIRTIYLDNNSELKNTSVYNYLFNKINNSIGDNGDEIIYYLTEVLKILEIFSELRNNESVYKIFKDIVPTNEFWKLPIVSAKYHNIPRFELFVSTYLKLYITSWIADKHQVNNSFSDLKSYDVQIITNMNDIHIINKVNNMINDVFSKDEHQFMFNLKAIENNNETIVLLLVIEAHLNCLTVSNVTFMSELSKAIQNKYTVEHIIPSYEKDKHQYINDLGNLGLLTTTGNSSLQNKPYIDKKPIYIGKAHTSSILSCMIINSQTKKSKETLEDKNINVDVYDDFISDNDILDRREKTIHPLLFDFLGI